MTITGQALALAGDDADDNADEAVQDDPDAIAMSTAHRVGDALHHLARASQRMQAARAASSPELRAAHTGHLARHLKHALKAAHGLTEDIREHYPAEAAELEQVKQAVGLAKAVSEDAKSATTAHLLETTLHELAHARRHAQAMTEDTPDDEWDFNADHAEKHLAGAAEHAEKLAQHLTDNYPAEGKWLEGLGEVTAGAEKDEGKEHARYSGSGGTVSAQLANAETITGQAALAGRPKAQAAAGTISGDLAAWERWRRDASVSITRQALDLTGDGHGHHVPGTPMVYKHGYVPITPGAGSPSPVSISGQAAAPPKLRDLVKAHLQAHPGETFTPHQVGKALNRSPGAVRNALITMAAHGIAEKVSDKPLAFRLAPGKKPAATAKAPALKKTAAALKAGKPAAAPAAPEPPVAISAQAAAAHAPAVPEAPDAPAAIKPLTGSQALAAVQYPKDITAAERSALKTYGFSHGYTVINPYLHHNGQVYDKSLHGYRAPTPAEKELAEKSIAGMDSAFAKAGPLTQPLTVYRGTGDVDALFGPAGSNVGKTFHSLAYTSTTTAAGGGAGNGYDYEKKKGRLTITVPAGSKALPGNAHEHEVILPRDATFKVVSDVAQPDGTRHIQLEYLPEGAPAAPSAEIPKKPAASATISAQAAAAPKKLGDHIVSHLQAHPGEGLTPYAIGKALNRSSGAVAYALAGLVANGTVEKTGDHPATYRLVHKPDLAETISAQAAKVTPDADPAHPPKKPKKPKPPVAAQAAEAVPVKTAEPAAQVKLGKGKASLVTFADGTKAVEKQGSKDTLDREYLAAAVAHAIGAPAPKTERAGPGAIRQEYITGQPGKDWVAKNSDAEYHKLTQTTEGLHIGLLDYLTLNNSRNTGNWLVGENGKPVAVANYGAFSGLSWVGDGGFAPKEGPDIPAALAASMRPKLEALKPQFEQAGRTDWYDRMMGQLANIESGKVLAAKAAKTAETEAAKAAAEKAVTSGSLPNLKGTWDKNAAAAHVMALGANPPKPLSSADVANFEASVLNPAYTYTDAQEKALKSYTGSGYTAMNQRLREGLGDTPAIKALKSAMQPLPQDMALTRNVYGDILAGVKPGDVIADHSFSSTTILPGSFSSSADTVMHITAPKGTPTVWAQPVSNHKTEHEMILAPGQPLAVTGVKPGTGPGGIKVTHVYLVAVPPGGTSGSISAQAAGA